MSEVKSYRSVPMVPTAAMAAAARFVEREWGCDGYQLGYAGVTTHHDGDDRQVRYTFQVRAGDGSRFLVWADRWENVGSFARDVEEAVALALDVEVS